MSDHESEIYSAAVLAYDAFVDGMSSATNGSWSHLQAYRAKAYERNKSCWRAFLELGKLCVDKEWYPVSYVTAALQLIGKNHNMITPRDLLHATVIKRYAEELERRKEETGNIADAEADWAYNVQTLEALALSTRAQVHGLLLNPTNPFPSWFRVFYADPPDSDLVKLYGDDAVAEIRKDPLLIAYLRQTRPQAMAGMEAVWGPM